MLSGFTLTPGEWKQFVAKFVDYAHEFAGFDIPAGCKIFPVADLAPCEIDEMEKAREEAGKPIPPMPVTYYAASFHCNNSVHVQIVGDSSTVISWLNCQSVGIGVLAKQIVDLRSMLYDNWTSLNSGATAPSENIAF